MPLRRTDTQRRLAVRGPHYWWRLLTGSTGIVLPLVMALASPAFPQTMLSVRPGRESVEIVDEGRGVSVATIHAPEAAIVQSATNSEFAGLTASEYRAPETSGKPGAALRLLGADRKGTALVTRWGRDPRFVIELACAPETRAGSVRVRLAGVWTGERMPHKGTGVEVHVRIPVDLEGTRVTGAVSFPAQDIHCLPTDFRVRQKGWSAHWGCTGFRFQESDKTLYFPAGAFKTKDRDHFLVTYFEPRTAFTLSARGERLSISRKLYLLPETGFRDESMDLHDGLEAAYHDIYLASVKNVTWDVLYWDYVLASFPEYTEPARFKLQNINQCGPAYPLNEGWVKRIYSYGNRMVHVGAFSGIDMTEEWLTKKGWLDASIPHGLGLHTSIAANRFAHDPVKEAQHGIHDGQEPEFLWENVKDAVIFDPDGKPRPSWSGMQVNMSPEFSYGRRVIEKAKDRVLKYNHSGFYMDYYADGNGVDSHHRYAQYPFYPIVVADSWFLKELSDWLHANGKYLHLNGPAPTLMNASRFYDLLSIDAKWDTMIQWKLQAVHKPFIAYGGTVSPPSEYAFTTHGWLQWGCRALFFGGAVPAWSWHPTGADALTNNLFYLLDIEVGQPFFARNALVNSRIGTSAICGGDLVKNTWSLFRHLEGAVYAVVMNTGKKPIDVHVPLSSSRTGLKEDKVYALIDWDLWRGGNVIARNMPVAEIRDQGWRVELEPDEIRVLCIEPERNPLVLGYFADLNLPEVPVLRGSSDSVLQAAIHKEPPRYEPHPRFVMKGVEGVQFEVRFGYTDKSKPSRVVVQGAEEYATKMAEGTLRIWGRLSEDLTVTFGAAGRGSLKLVEGEVQRRSDAFEDAEVVYDSTSDPSFEKWSLETEADWTGEDGVLVRGAPLDEKGPPTREQFATALLDVDLSGDYEITYRSRRTSIDRVTYLAKVRTVIGKIGEELLVLREQDGVKGFRDTLPALYQGDTELLRGLDTSTHPNPYTKHERSYDWRVRKMASDIEFAVSYDGGLTFELLLNWQAPAEFVPKFGIRTRYTALRLEAVRVRK